MKMSHKILGCGTMAAALAFSASTLKAQNLIQNPGFDTGDLTSWTTGGTSVNATIGVLPTGGNPTDYAWMNNQVQASNLLLGQNTPLGSVGAGILVNYSFDLYGGSQANGGVDFIHIFDKNATDGVISQGPGLLGPYFPSATGWTHYSGSFTTVAGSDHLYIEFDATTGANIGSVDQIGVDNVNLTPAPEPTTLALAGLGGAAALSLIRRRKV